MVEQALDLEGNVRETVTRRHAPQVAHALEVASEEGIFRLLGLPYYPPDQVRDTYVTSAQPVLCVGVCLTGCTRSAAAPAQRQASASTLGVPPAAHDPRSRPSERQRAAQGRRCMPRDIAVAVTRSSAKTIRHV